MEIFLGLFRVIKLILHFLQDLFFLCLRFFFRVDDDRRDNCAANDVEDSHRPELSRTWRVSSVPCPTPTAKDDKRAPPGCFNSRKNQWEKNGREKKPGKSAGKVDLQNTIKKIEEGDGDGRVF